MTPTAASLAQQGQEIKAASADRLPANVVHAFDTGVKELVAQGVPAGVAAVGSAVPDVELIDAQGAQTSLFAVTGERPAVLVFYRGAWCPYCNLALRTYGDQLLAPLTQRGTGLVALSPQKPDGSLSMQEKHDLKFPVVSDPGNTLARQLGILMPPRSEELRAAQEQVGLRLEAVNADGTEAIPLPTVVVLNADHTIGWIDVRPDFTARAEVDDILAAVDSVLGAPVAR